MSVSFTRNSDFVYRKIADEVILVPVYKGTADLGALYTLNELGAFLWEQLETPHTLHELKQIITAEYAADEQVVQSDLGQFMQELIEIGAVVQE